MAGVPALEIELGRKIRVRIAATAPKELALRSHQSVGRTMIPLPPGVRVWIAGRSTTDMRRRMQSLALQVQEVLRRDPLLCVG